MSSVIASLVRGLTGESIGYPEIKFDRAWLFRETVGFSDVANDTVSFQHKIKHL